LGTDSSLFQRRISMIALLKKLPRHSLSWFRLGIVGLFLLSFALRFWELGRFNSLVFDEAHFAKYANNYLTHTPFSEMHPPLGKYLIAIGIWFSKLNPFGYGDTNNLTGSSLAPFSYRCMNALTGSFIPLVVVGLAYQFSYRRSFALLAGLFIAVDGLFLVESRYALINIYLIIFGLLGQWLVLLSLDRSPKQQEILLILAGICFGASTAVKWNGLAFLLGIYLLWISAKLVNWMQARWSTFAQSKTSETTAPETQFSETGEPELQPISHPLDLPLSTATSQIETPVQKLAQLKFLDILCNLGIVPAIAYYLTWIPHLQLNSSKSFWGWHQYMIWAHNAVGNGPNVHPYCSAWYTWLLMQRPIWYYFEQVKAPPQVSSLLSSATTDSQTITEYNVHAMGNPLLWWFSTIAIAVFLIGLIQTLVLISARITGKRKKLFLTRTPSFWISLFLILNYIANLLPWVEVSRCTFLYHYMGAYVFALLALAWFIDQWLQSNQAWLQTIGSTAIVIVLVAFVYWMPIYLGLPLSPKEHESLMWFSSWR
jgi:dolichyl-phosphate-mannose-protein mannosyltransferase